MQLWRLARQAERRINNAKNVLNERVLDFQFRELLVDELANIISESVKPMEKIESIKILQAEGLFGPGGGSNGRAPSSNGGGENLADSVTNAALRYRAQSPLVDALMKELGLEGGDINGLTQALKGRKEDKGKKAPEPDKEAPTASRDE